MKIMYADLQSPEELKGRVLARTDIASIKRQLVVHVVQQLVEIDRRPRNWNEDVEVNIDFSLEMRAQMRTHGLDYAKTRVYLQGVFPEWKVRIGNSPVGRLTFCFRLDKSLCPAVLNLPIPTVNPKTACKPEERAAVLKELIPCSS